MDFVADASLSFLFLRTPTFTAAGTLNLLPSGRTEEELVNADEKLSSKSAKFVDSTGAAVTLSLKASNFAKSDAAAGFESFTLANSSSNRLSSKTAENDAVGFFKLAFESFVSPKGSALGFVDVVPFVFLLN